MAPYHAPQDWKDRSDWLAAGLDGRSRWRLAPLILGLVFGQGRRVVAAWLRAAGLSDDCWHYAEWHLNFHNVFRQRVFCSPIVVESFEESFSFSVS